MSATDSSSQSRTFTQASQVRGLQPEAKAFEVRDALSPKHKGLVLRVQPTGAKPWWFVYKLNGKRYRLSVGDYPNVSLNSARDIADRWRVMLKDESQLYPHEAIEQQARDKVAREAREALESHRDEWTVRKLAKLFLEALRKGGRRPRTVDTYTRLLENFVYPVIGDLLAHEVTWSDIEDVLEHAGKRKKGGLALTQRNLAHAVLNAMFAWAIGTRKSALSVTPPKHLRGLANPVATVQRTEIEPQKKRALTDSEASALWAALQEEKGPAVDAIALIMLTGCRIAETIGSKWEHVNLSAEKPTWTIPAEVTKNHNEHTVFLSPKAVSLLEAITGDHDGYIFASGKSFSGPSIPIGYTTVRRKLKSLLTRTERNTTISPHYFRHTLVAC
jgi:integrase